MSAPIDTVGQQLTEALLLLEAQDLKYNISYTSPKREKNTFAQNLLFVIRQRVDGDGLYHLTVAAKLNLS